MQNFKTGDLLLFSYKPTSWAGWLDEIIYWGTHSYYSHTAVILKDPTFIHPTLKGTFVWQSGESSNPDPQDGKVKLGVQITPLGEILDSYKGSGHCYYRSINCNSGNFTEENLKKVHEVVYDKPYDVCPIDWVEAFLKKDPNPQKTSRFWCSALVGYIYTKCGILDPSTDWSILSPSDFSIEGQNLTFCEGMSLSNTQTKLF